MTERLLFTRSGHQAPAAGGADDRTRNRSGLARVTAQGQFIRFWAHRRGDARDQVESMKKSLAIEGLSADHLPRG